MTREFPDKARPRDLGDPALDPPMTVRVEGGQDRAVRYSTTARRAIKTDAEGPVRWCVVVGRAIEPRWLRDDQVRDWPVVPAVVNEAAYANWGSRAPREGLVQPAERGDLDVTVFKGER